MPRAGASGGMLNELMGSCRVWEVFDSPQCPLCFPYLHLPLRTNSFSELPRAPCHLALDLLACLGCCPSQAVSAHQTLPGEAAARVPGSCIFFSFSFVFGLSASSADGIFIMFSESPYGLTRESISLIVKHDHLF